jgi:hypothetical protein
MRQRLGLAAALLGVGNLAAAFAALTGVLLVTGEYRYGTIRPTFLFNPSRGRVVAAKLAASLLAGLAVGIVSEMLSFVIGVIVLAGRMVPLELSTSCLASSPVVGRFTPARSGDSLIGLTAPQHSLPAWAGGTMLVAWAAALAIGGFVLIRRRDVS